LSGGKKHGNFRNAPMFRCGDADPFESGLI
jgi:hypothetical protein